MTLSYPDLAMAVATVALAYAVFGFSGFGANMVALPILVHILNLQTAVVLLLLLDLCSASMMGLNNRKLIDWAELFRLAPSLLVGIGIGVMLLHQTSERWLLLILGVFVIGFSLWNLFGHRGAHIVSPAWAWPAGLAGGVFSSLFGTGGPVYTLYLVHRLADTTKLRATIGAIILGTAIARFFVYAGSGLMSSQPLILLAVMLAPCALIGYLIGSRVHDRLPQNTVRRGIWILLLFSGLNLLVQNLVIH